MSKSFIIDIFSSIKRWSLIKTWNIAIDAKINYYQFSYMSTIFLCLCKIKHRSTFLNTVPKWTICQSYDSRKEEIFSFANRHFYTRKEKRERQEAKNTILNKENKGNFEVESLYLEIVKDECLRNDNILSSRITFMFSE